MQKKQSRNELATSLTNVTLQDQTRITAVSKIPADFCAFNGHFPNEPIMPGICQIQLISVLVSKALNKEYFLNEIKRVKFYNIVCPNDVLRITCDISEIQADLIAVKAMVYKHDEQGKEIKVSLVKIILN